MSTLEMMAFILYIKRNIFSLARSNFLTLTNFEILKKSVAENAGHAALKSKWTAY
jgi:hypothetical protein